ncbi:MAG: aspartate 1-decarboxylase [Alphaproteobacteria bacterium]|jgi:aspartate 1-decarboxylase|nr:aspartate 1-decarboxylase [Alphaproteobacteria bacterium]
MNLTLLKCKLHRAKVTETDLEYNGSISIDQNLLDEAGILDNERVEIYNITNGSRFATYAIPAERGSKKIGINGAAAHLTNKDDLVIICAYAQMSEKEARDFKPKVILLDKNNDIV